MSKFDLIFMGDSYTQGYGLFYHYWCENNIEFIEEFQRIYDIDMVESAFFDNKAHQYMWDNRFSNLVASHFNTSYITNCWDSIGHFSSYDGFPKSRERVHTGATKIIQSYLEYFEEYGNTRKRIFVLQTSDVTRDTLLNYAKHSHNNVVQDRISNILSNMNEMIAKDDGPNINHRRMWEAFTKLLINSDDLIFQKPDMMDELPWPKNPNNLLDSIDDILYKMWEIIWLDMEKRLKQYNCELILIHTHNQFLKGVSKLENNIHFLEQGWINHTLRGKRVKDEILRKYNIKVNENHPGLELHQEIADAIIKKIKEIA